MKDKITSSLDSISFVNHLAIAKRAEIGNIVIEVKGNFSIQDALIVKNILLLLNQAGKLDYVSRPLNIAGWVTIYNKDDAPEPEPIPEEKLEKPKRKEYNRHNDDLLDALRYSLGVDPEEDKLEPAKSLRDISGKTISIKDVNLALDAVDIGKNIDQYVNQTFIKRTEKLPGGVPKTFVEDMEKFDNDALAQMYDRGIPTIKRWKKLLKGGLKDESSE